MIKMVVMDIDGVVTDGTMLFDHEGRELKRIYYRDLGRTARVMRAPWRIVLEARGGYGAIEELSAMLLDQQ